MKSLAVSAVGTASPAIVAALVSSAPSASVVAPLPQAVVAQRRASSPPDTTLPDHVRMPLPSVESASVEIAVGDDLETRGCDQPAERLTTAHET